MKFVGMLTAFTAVTLSLGLAIPATAQVEAAPASAERALTPQRFTVETIGNGSDVILIPGLSTPRDV